MKQCIFFLASLLVALPSFALDCLPKALMGYDQGWRPYQYQEEGKAQGLDVELVSAVMEQMGCPISFQASDWHPLLEKVERGSVHMLAGVSYTDERALYGFFSDILRSEEMTLFVRKGERDQFPLSTLEDIHKIDFVLGLVASSYYGENVSTLLADRRYKKHLSFVDDVQENYKKLVNNQIDGLLADPVAARSTSQLLGLDNKIQQHGLSINRSSVYVLFSMATVDEAFVYRFNKGLRQIRQNKVYKQIIDKYS